MLGSKIKQDILQDQKLGIYAIWELTGTGTWCGTGT